ncbi:MULTISPECIES: RNA-guided endonuclease IscB [Streptomyces]|uniref:RNA-guided endonuclease IscB n=1 Tax=Streptomyces lonegramiae TaxID=3075524 RepID=A0ABU2XI80_9ACTN|nr:RNA-guided endonuclease IscB [Streptomyces sp. DSM 41529]MDT0545220.1 RNA-guided endonuclease IscB [Streptomyces sp. DSM 41529]
MEHVRGEIPTASPGGGGVTPNQPVGEEPRERHPFVFVLDKHGQPLQPCTPARARKLLKKGRAVVHRHTPFAIRLKDRTLAESEVDGVELGIDPGSKHTGIATFTARAGERRGRYAVQLDHRGAVIRKRMGQRAAYRRRRRTSNLRYRAPRFNNRPRPDGWLAPSLQHRVTTTVSWVRRLSRWAPVRAVHVERVAFDTHAISAGRPLEGAEYQHGTLHGTEAREYLLAKFGRTCVYCGITKVPLNIDHVHPRSRGGSDRISNLVTACIPCNETKSNRPVEEFVRDTTKLAKILGQAKAPLRDAAAVQSTRWALWRALDQMLPTHIASGGRTKWNRTRCGLPKSHTLDALNVGKLDTVTETITTILVAGCSGRGRHQRTSPDRHGFPRRTSPRIKTVHGYATGDLVTASVPTGKYTGTHTGRVMVRTTGKFDIRTPHGLAAGIRHTNIRLLQRGDGYAYAHQAEPTHA